MRLLKKLLRLWRFQGGLSLSMEACLAGLSLTVLSLFSAYGLYRVQLAASELEHQVEQGRQIVMALRQYSMGVGDVQNGARNYALVHDPMAMMQYYQGVEEAQTSSRDLHLLMSDPDSRQQFERIDVQFDRFVSATVPTLLGPTPVFQYNEQQSQAVREGNAQMMGVREGLTRLSDRLINELRDMEQLRNDRTRRASMVYAVVSLCITFLGVLGGVLFAFRVRSHILSLTDSAHQVAAGDYGRRVEAGGNREFGELAKAFNSMVIELEERRRQDALSKRFWELLHASASMSDVQSTVAQLCPQWMPGSTGSLYVLNQSRSALESGGGWGDYARVESFPPMQCWALRMGRPHAMLDIITDVCCEHLRNEPRPTACVPLVAHGETVGLIVIELAYPEISPAVMELSEALAMTIANIRMKERMQAEANRDPLTGLFNRRYLNEALSRELARARRHSLALTVIALDIDYFKSFNDTFGHGAGDLVLKQISRTLVQSLRSSDIVCRQGGEEFLAILPHCRPDDGMKWGEVIRHAVQSLHLVHENQMLGPITISAGVAGYPEHGTSIDELLAAADRALYESKEATRNCVTLATVGIRLPAAGETAVEQANSTQARSVLRVMPPPAQAEGT